MTFTALRVHRADTGVDARFDTLELGDLSDGDVVIRALWSGVNYKDALAVTGAGRIMRHLPMVAGIDVAGVVTSSSDPRYAPGDPVLVVGCGLSETHDGGFSEVVRVPGEWVVPLPDGLSLRDTMIIGTAGFTAALAVDLMLRNLQSPAAGPVAVTGATGGVGSFAIDLLAGLGFEVHAITGKPGASTYLRELGAAEIVSRHDLDLGTRPLERGRWGGAVDNLGGDLLAWLTRTTRPFGNIASIGLAANPELHTTVMPFILRGVNLLGVNSVLIDRERRLAVWRRLGSDLRPRHLDAVVSQTVDLADLMRVFPPMIEGSVRGRTLVRIGEPPASR